MSDFKKRHAMARKIQAKHPRKAYKACFEEAGRKVGKVKRPAKKKKRAPKKVGAKYKVYHEVKRVGGVTYKGGSLKLGTIAQTTSHLEKQLDAKLQKELLARHKAKNKTARKKIQKRINEIARQERAIGSIRRR